MATLDELKGVDKKLNRLNSLPEIESLENIIKSSAEDLFNTFSDPTIFVDTQTKSTIKNIVSRLDATTATNLLSDLNTKINRLVNSWNSTTSDLSKIEIKKKIDILEEL
jgi:hypothetical protein